MAPSAEVTIAPTNPPPRVNPSPRLGIKALRQRLGNAKANVYEKAKASAFNEHPRKPTGNSADDKRDYQCHDFHNSPLTPSDPIVPLRRVLDPVRTSRAR